GFKLHGAAAATHYHAPEVVSGRAATPASDQFSFCASLWHALYAVRSRVSDDPFDQPLAAGTDSGIATIVSASRAPAWIAKIVERGLRARPEERYASMEELLAALEQSGKAGPRREQLRSLLAYAPLALVPLAASGLEVRDTTPFSHM